EERLNDNVINHLNTNTELFKGPKGDEGKQGQRGPQGERGVKGDTGERGLEGPQGPQGDTGPQGIQGERGEDINTAVYTISVDMQSPFEGKKLFISYNQLMVSIMLQGNADGKVDNIK